MARSIAVLARRRIYSGVPAGAAAYEFGTLTLTGAGGITAPGGATISSSTIDGLELSGGYLVRKATGTVTSGTVTWSTGSVWTITAVTGYSFRTMAELQAIIALGVVTLSGKTAYGRYLGPGNSITWGGVNPLDSLTFTSTFTLTSHSGEGGNCRFKSNHWVAGVAKDGRVSGTSKLRLTNLEFFHETDRRYLGYTISGFNIGSGTTDIEIDNCLFEGNFLDVGHGPKCAGLTVVGASSTAVITIRDNVFRFINYGIIFTAAVKTIVAKRNEVLNFSGDAIRATGSPNVGDTQKWLKNYVHDPLTGRYHIRFITGTYLKKTTELTGAADSKKFFIAFFVRNCRDAANAAVLIDYCYTQGTNIELFRDATGKYRFKAKDTGGATVLDMTSVNTHNVHVGNSGGLFTWIVVSADTDGTTRMYSCNEYDRVWVEEATATAAGQTLDLTAGAATIGADAAFGNDNVFTEVGRCAVWHGIAPDITSATVQNYFSDWTNLDLMKDFATARTALGNPIVDFAGTLDEWRAGTNKGTGGSFTEVGSLDTGHADLFQCDAENNVKGMIVAGNVFVGFRSDLTYESESGMQGLFLNDIHTFSNTGLLSACNIVVSNHLNGHNPHNVTDGYILHNTLVMPTDAIPSGLTESGAAPRIYASLQGASVAPNNEIVADNIAYDCDLSSAVSSVELNSLDIRHSTLNTNFAGSSFTKSDLNTYAKIMTALRNEAGGPAATAVPQQGALPYGADFFDWTNGDWWDLPRYNEATYSAPADLTNQTLATLVESAAVQVTVKRNPDAADAVNGAMVRVPAGVSVKILASDGTTTVTDWTATGVGAIVGNGQYYKLRATSNAGYSTTDNYTYYVGKVADTWSITTEAGTPVLGVYHQSTSVAPDDFNSTVSVTLPSGITTGNSLIAIVSETNQSGTPTLSPSTGWTLVGSTTSTACKLFVFKKLNASAADSGTTLTFTFAGSCLATIHVYEVGAPNGGIEMTSATATDDPPNFAPSGGSSDYVFIGVAASLKNDMNADAAPSGYSGLLYTETSITNSNSTSNTALASAYVQKSGVSSEDPGAFTWTGARNTPVAATISVR